MIDRPFNPFEHFVRFAEGAINHCDKNGRVRAFLSGTHTLEQRECALALSLRSVRDSQHGKSFEAVWGKLERPLMFGDGLIIALKPAEVPAQEHVRPIVVGIDLDALAHLS